MPNSYIPTPYISASIHGYPIGVTPATIFYVNCKSVEILLNSASEYLAWHFFLISRFFLLERIYIVTSLLLFISLEPFQIKNVSH